MNRDDRGAWRADGNGVLRVHERCAHAPEQSGQRPEHPGLLQRCPQLERLDALRNERRVARHRCDPEVGAELAELAEQVADVRLVAGAAAAEHVRVDDDERHAHPRARR